MSTCAMMSVAQAASSVMAASAGKAQSARRMSGRNCFGGGVEVVAVAGRSRRRRAAVVATGAVMAASDAAVEVARAEDKWIAGSIERCAVGAGVQALREQGMTQLAHARVPTSRVEEWRFTDLAPLATAQPVAADPAAAAAVDATPWTLSAADTSRIVLVDGVYCPEKSNLSGVKGGGIQVGMLSAGVTPMAAGALGAQTAQRGGFLVSLNAVMASDAVVVNVPAGARLETPLHIVQLSTAAHAAGAAGLSSSAPRVVVVLGEGAEASLVEEFAAAPGVALDAPYWHNGVCELVLEKGAKLTHTMVQSQSRAAVHTRATLLTQAEESVYALAEVNLGGRLGRHDLGVKQLGARTETRLACFNLAGAGQCIDLHSSVVLDHEEGKTDQVHKCIVSASTGKGVFDGNVQVNRQAQRTAAGQISRNLLLVPKATVNVKPNLQIVADDVVCTHGCTVSDLEEEALFYIQSRGLSPAIARSLLVAGFGLEIVSKIGSKDLKERVALLVRASLDRDNVKLAA
eukprot:CAMPEP_0197580608 /NCGR_PEP_ID=MMETSP1326-20131121/4355_1 /TAXON_ID=1155430 /ORGANISM="Genus nov. species nov., Strain RCC2288" /LENGTH=515 /DNA_ID=CAMNT_0043144391 /DNA_START=98 /DNA_END=1645 /DNA_ORIENTATION=+